MKMKTQMKFTEPSILIRNEDNFEGNDDIDQRPNLFETIREYAMIGVCLLLCAGLFYSSIRLCRSQRAKFTFDAIILLVQVLVVSALVVYEF